MEYNGFASIKKNRAYDFSKAQVLILGYSSINKIVKINELFNIQKVFGSLFFLTMSILILNLDIGFHSAKANKQTNMKEQNSLSTSRSILFF